VAWAIGADHGVGITAVAAAIALGLVVVWHWFATPRADAAVFRRVERGLGLLDSATAAVLALAIAADGVFAI
jgi:hypothetical protein